MYRAYRHKPINMYRLHNLSQYDFVHKLQEGCTNYVLTT